MTVGIAWGLAAAAGAITGAIAARRRGHSQASPVAYALIGALLAALVFAGFLAAGAVLSLLLWSGGAPDPVPALLCVVLTCAGFLLFTWAGEELAPASAPVWS